MPRKSDRQHTLQWMKKIIEKLKQGAIKREVLSEDYCLQDDEDELMIIIHQQMLRMCYLFCNKKYRNRKKMFDLEECLSMDSQTYIDKEFLFNFCLSRKFFYFLKKFKLRRLLKRVNLRVNDPLHFNCWCFSSELVKKDLEEGLFV
jgi:hypothetical protein